jgi:predicted O-methyltransferase YrrM
VWSKSQSAWKAWLAEFTGDRVDPERSTGPWSGHREFAYDLIRWRQPDVLVELGTQYGVSFFAFCQAVTDEEADTELHAIDTWQGDEHAGFYDESVFERFQDSVKAFPSARIRIHRSTFLEALTDFKDDSVDLIHIDGLHTYEALKEDYESWLPKLAENGVVLLHDVSPASGYGSARYYEQQVVDSAPGFSFPHSFGLGVVFPKGTQGWEPLLSDSFTGWKHFYPARAEASLLRQVERDQTKLIDERTTLIAQYEKKIALQVRTLERNAAETEAMKAALQTTSRQLDERTKQVARLERTLERTAAEAEAMETALRSTSRQLRQARDRVHQLAPLESSPKAQLRALRHALPRSLGTRAPRWLQTRVKRHRASFRVARAERKRRHATDDSPHPSTTIDSMLGARVSLQEILSEVAARYPQMDRSDAERRIFAGVPLNSDHAERTAGSSQSEGVEAEESPEASLVNNGFRSTGQLRALVEQVDVELITVDIWDTLILRDRPADAAKTATGRRISLLSRNLPTSFDPDPFKIAELRVEVEAEMAAGSPSEEYELARVIELVLERLGHAPEAARSELAGLLAAEEARDEVRWSSPNGDLVQLIREAPQPTPLVSDFYMGTELLKPIVTQVTGLDERLFVSIDMGVSKRLDGGMFDAVRAEYQTGADRHLHIGDNPHSDVEQQVRGGGIALQIPRPTRFPGPGDFDRQSIRECWSELDRRIGEGLPETDDRFRSAGRLLAPLAVGMVSLAVEEAIDSGVDRVHYLSREGAFLDEIHQLVEPVLRPVGLPEVRGVHLEVSRLSTFSASLEPPIRDSLHRMWSMYARQSVSAMLTSIGLVPEDVSDHLKECGLTPETKLVDAGNDPRVRDLFDLPEFGLLVSEHVELSRALLGRYIAERTELTDPFVVVDIGWRGTIQDNLVRALGIERSTGIYFGLFPFLNAQAPGSRKVALAFDGNAGEEFGFAEPPAVLERPWTADVPSTIGYRQEGGSVVPVESKEAGAVSPGIASFQQGTREAAPIVAEWIVGMGLTADLLRPGLSERAKRLWLEPPTGVADIWFESDHDDTFGALNQVGFHKLRPDRTWLKGGLRRHIEQGEKMSGWPAGYRAWSPVRGIVALAALWSDEGG